MSKFEVVIEDTCVFKLTVDAEDSDDALAQVNDMQTAWHLHPTAEDLDGYVHMEVYEVEDKDE